MAKGIFLFLLGAVLCGIAVMMEMSFVVGAVQEIEAFIIGFCGLMLIAAGCVLDELSKILTELKKC